LAVSIRIGRPATQLETRHAGQQEIEDDEVGLFSLDQAQSQLAVLRFDDTVMLAVQVVADELSNIGLVFDHQDFLRSHK
jgi:hypothetical protein